jgi:hypothetical protein
MLPFRQKLRGSLAIGAALGNTYAQHLGNLLQGFFSFIIGPSAMMMYMEAFQRYNLERLRALQKQGPSASSQPTDLAPDLGLNRTMLATITGASFATAGICAASMPGVRPMILSSLIGLQALEVGTLTTQALLTLRAKNEGNTPLENTVEAATLASRSARGFLASYSLLTILWHRIKKEPLPPLVGKAGKGIVGLNSIEFFVILMQEAREAYAAHEHL